MLERVEKSAIAEGDSDLEVPSPSSFFPFCYLTELLSRFVQVDTEIPQLDAIINWETIRHLKPKEKKRQEVINGERLFSISHD